MDTKSRELKFRAWDKVNKIFTTWEDDRFNVCDFIASSYKNQIIQQYTGLKDKNGKEIYSSDYVKGREGTLLGEVKFGEYQRPAQTKHDRPAKNMGWYVETKRGNFSLEDLNWYIDTKYKKVRRDYLEVVGNKFEGLQNSGEGDII